MERSGLPNKGSSPINLWMPVKHLGGACALLLFECEVVFLFNGVVALLL